MLPFRTPLSAASVALVAALSACSTAPMPVPTPTPTGDAAGGPAEVDCVIGTWSLDGDDAAAQIFDIMSLAGAPLTESDSLGEVTLTFEADGTATYASDITYLIRGSDRHADFTISQSITGTSGGRWGWTNEEKTVMFFPRWENGLAIHGEVSANGKVYTSPYDFDDPGFGSAATHVECSPDALVTHAEESPFTQHWSR